MGFVFTIVLHSDTKTNKMMILHNVALREGMLCVPSFFLFSFPSVAEHNSSMPSPANPTMPGGGSGNNSGQD